MPSRAWPWTEAEDRRLIRMHRDGDMTVSEMASALSRPRGSVSGRINRFIREGRLKRKRPATRTELTEGRTPAEQKLLDAVQGDGEVWVTPGQHRMVRRLERKGLVVLTDDTRPNVLRGSVERRVVVAESEAAE